MSCRCPSRGAVRFTAQSAPGPILESLLTQGRIGPQDIPVPTAGKLRAHGDIFVLGPLTERSRWRSVAEPPIERHSSNLT